MSPFRFEGHHGHLLQLVRPWRHIIGRLRSRRVPAHFAMICAYPFELNRVDWNERTRSAGPLPHRRTVPLAVLVGTIILSSLLSPVVAPAQKGRKHKVPVINKITSGGGVRQAFTGKVQSVDTKHKVLNVGAAEGGGMEIFPVKKSVSITSADGDKLKLAELKPGSNIIIYYEQKGGERTVKQIVVLAPGADEAKKKPPPPM